MKVTPKRVNFVAIQHGHGIACVGYRQPSVRTGYEQVLPHRNSDLFATTAQEGGRVISRNANGIIIRYDSGKTVGIELGRRYGQAEGLTIPHTVASELNEGDSFKTGDIISYNTGFYERDVLNPSQVVWKAGLLVNTVLLESNQTLEDASSISLRLAEQLKTAQTKIKDVVVEFGQQLHNVVQVGAFVNPENILCTIADETASNANLLDEQSLNTLRLLENKTPTAKIKGVVERVEVFYHGDKEDMSSTLLALANASDRELAKRYRSRGKTAFNGQVMDDFRVDNEPLALDTAVIRFYITSEVPAGVGDKGVFCNQMKTVFSEVLPQDIRTESGVVIDAVFGQKSIDDRIVNSPGIIGTTNTLLQVIGKKATQIYRGK